MLPHPKQNSFWEKVNIGADSECWEWQYAKSGYGYGFTGLRGLPVRAHRAAYLLTHGNIPQGKNILHHCDNTSCCNPKHLYAGTQQDNVNDMYDRGRSKYPRGIKKVKSVRQIPVDPRLATWPYAPSSNLVDLMDMAT